MIKLIDLISEKAKRDYKAEYKKYGSSTKAKKYRAELNAYNRKKGTYGNGDGKDASHKGGKIVGFEAESKNRGRAEKSRLKKEGKLTEGSLKQAMQQWKYIEKRLKPKQKKLVQKALKRLKPKMDKYFKNKDYQDYIDGELDIKVPLPDLIFGDGKVFGQLITAYSNAIKEPAFYEGKLTEGKWKFKGKYLTMPGGEISSIPRRNERDRIVIRIKNEEFRLYDNKFDEFHIIGDRNDYFAKGKNDLLRFLNKHKAKYIGIDN